MVKKKKPTQMDVMAQSEGAMQPSSDNVSDSLPLPPPQEEIETPTLPNQVPQGNQPVTEVVQKQLNWRSLKYL